MPRKKDPLSLPGFDLLYQHEEVTFGRVEGNLVDLGTCGNDSRMDAEGFQGVARQD
jgi:hypothetical protein